LIYTHYYQCIRSVSALLVIQLELLEYTYSIVILNSRSKTLHITGNTAYGVCHVDLFWKDVADTSVQFNVPADDLIELFGAEVKLIPIDYNTAHNIIYGAESFAADFDIKAHRDFELSQMILEEDDDRIPIIDIEFGKDGKPFKIIRMDDQGDDDEDYGL
jgi:hypothetical protein